MDLYDILGVKRDAGEAEIRRAYRRLARRYHPGINPGDREAEARFEQVTLAFETLTDPARRQAYDQGARAEPAPAEPVSFGFAGFDFSMEVTSGERVPTFGELFADVLTRPGAGPAAGPEAGPDLHAMLSVSLDEVMAGADRYVTITRQVPCRTCAGAGLLRVDPVPCAVCQGTGHIRSLRGHMVFAKRCAACDGTGAQVLAPCRTCVGQGVEARVESLSVHVPAGVADGAEVRVAGGGHAGRRGGRAGDLVLSVRVEPHPLFVRDGDDLHLAVPVAIHEAALGARVEVPTPDGPVRLRIPPGTQSGQRLRLHGRGVPSVRDGQRGDLIVEVRLVLPSLLDERSKELMREFGEINGEDVRQGLWSGLPGR
jgi:molecular chaperone DnaJ